MIQRIRKTFRGNDTTTKRFVLFATVCVLGAVLAYTQMGWVSYVEGWIGAVFRATTGGVLGFMFSRFGTGLRLGYIENDAQRAEAGKSQALLIVGFAVAVAVGV